MAVVVVAILIAVLVLVLELEEVEGFVQHSVLVVGGIRSVVDGARGRLVLSALGLRVLGRALPDVVLRLLVVHVLVDHPLLLLARSLVVPSSGSTQPRDPSSWLLLALIVALLLLLLAVALRDGLGVVVVRAEAPVVVAVVPRLSTLASQVVVAVAVAVVGVLRGVVDGGVRLRLALSFSGE